MCVRAWVWVGVCRKCRTQEAVCTRPLITIHQIDLTLWTWKFPFFTFTRCSQHDSYLWSIYYANKQNRPDRKDFKVHMWPKIVLNIQDKWHTHSFCLHGSCARLPACWCQTADAPFPCQNCRQMMGLLRNRSYRIHVTTATTLMVKQIYNLKCQCGYAFSILDITIPSIICFIVILWRFVNSFEL